MPECWQVGHSFFSELLELKCMLEGQLSLCYEDNSYYLKQVVSVEHD